MRCKEGKDWSNDLQKLLLRNTSPANRGIMLSLSRLGSAVLALPLPADAPAEEI